MLKYSKHLSYLTAILFIISSASTSSFAGQDCANATYIPLDGCPGTTWSGGTGAFSNPSGEAHSCGVAGDYDDVWYMVVATTNSTTVTAASTGSSPNIVLQILTGDCGSLSEVDCQSGGNTHSSTFATTVGQTYYVRVWRDGSNSNVNVDLTFCTSVAPSNDACASATPLTVDAACTYNGNQNATSSGAPDEVSPSCGYSIENVVWYTFVAPAGGEVEITFDLDRWNVESPDLQFAVYSGTCGSLTEVTCDDDSGFDLAPRAELTGLTPGATYYIALDGFGGQEAGYCIQVNTPPNCGTCAGSSCGAACVLTSDPASPTDALNTDCPTYVYTMVPHDLGGDAVSTCWDFTATDVSGTVNMYFSSLGGGCSGVSGINWTNYDNACGSVQTGTTTPPALTGMTAGADYTFCISYTINGSNINCAWTEFLTEVTMADVLPVELVDFDAIYVNNNQVNVKWQTLSEDNNDYFTVYRSYDGFIYEEIAIVPGAGNSNEPIFYQYEDKNVKSFPVYYELVQTDFDGTREKLGKDIVHQHSSPIALFPNPVKEELFFTMENATGNVRVDIVDMNGRVVLSRNYSANSSNISKNINTSELSEGVYFVKVISGTQVLTEKIVKKN